MLTKILTFFKPTKNFRITSTHSKKLGAQIGNVFYAITEDNPSSSLKHTVLKSTSRYVKAQNSVCVSEYFGNRKIDEYNRLRIRYFDRKAFDSQFSQIS